MIELVKKLDTKNKANKDELLRTLQTLKSNTGMNKSEDLADAFPGNETLRELVNKIPSLTGATAYRTKRKIQVHVATLLKDLADKVAREIRKPNKKSILSSITMLQQLTE